MSPAKYAASASCTPLESRSAPDAPLPRNAAVRTEPSMTTARNAPISVSTCACSRVMRPFYALVLGQIRTRAPDRDACPDMSSGMPYNCAHEHVHRRHHHGHLLPARL